MNGAFNRLSQNCVANTPADRPILEQGSKSLAFDHARWITDRRPTASLRSLSAWEVLWTSTAFAFP